MLYKLTAWEDNGYDDSYFYESWWNTETGAVEFHETGSTAYAGGAFSNTPVICDPVELERAIAWLAEHVYQRIRAAEYRDILTPEPVNCHFGREFRLLRNCRNAGRVIPEGAVGELLQHMAFGNFYRNGYNRPSRENTRLQLRLADGSQCWVALSACRQQREPLTDEQLRVKAEELARNCGFSAASGYKHAWDTFNYAADYLGKIEQQQRAAA